MPRSLTEALTASPVALAEARRAEADGGVPSKPGIYAFWISDGLALPEVPAPPHPAFGDLGLLYVGIAPKNAASRETLRSRILKKHAAVGLAGSTFRRKLAALLFESHGWTPRLTATRRWKLDAEQDALLLAWLTRNLRLNTWPSKNLHRRSTSRATAITPFWNHSKRRGSTSYARPNTRSATRGARTPARSRPS